VQGFPSSQGVVLGFAGFGQSPVAVSQVPTLWHWSNAVQVLGFEPVQTPDTQVSVCVQGLPSSHTGPVAGTQVPVVGEHVLHPVHGFPVFCQAPVSSHVRG
jgi:hypothetical protein